MYGNTVPERDRHERATTLIDAERFYSTTFQKEVKALGGRPYDPRPDFPEETARP